MADLVDRLVARARGTAGERAVPARPPVPPGLPEAFGDRRGRARGPAEGAAVADDREPRPSVARPLDVSPTVTRDHDPARGGTSVPAPPESGVARPSTTLAAPGAAEVAAPSSRHHASVGATDPPRPAVDAPVASAPVHVAAARADRVQPEPLDPPEREPAAPTDPSIALPVSGTRTTPAVPGTPTEPPGRRSEVTPEAVVATPAVTLLPPRLAPPAVPEAAPAGDARTVHIHIGRVDIRGTDPVPAPGPAVPVAPPTAEPPVLSLGDYLQGRTTGAPR